MLRLERALPASLLLLMLLGTAACSKLTFIRQDVIGKGKVEQARRPVVARDSQQDKARMSAHDLVVRASSALQGNDLDTAERLSREALKADPASADAHTLMGAIAARRGREAESGDWLFKAMQVSAGGAAEANNYGAWLCGQSRFEESLRYLDYAAERLGDSQSRADTLANAGACALRAGNAERATAYLRQSLQLDAENRLALETLANHALSQGQLMEARAFIERRLALLPVTAALLQNAEQIELRMGDTRAAARYRERLQRDFPSNSSTGN